MTISRTLAVSFAAGLVTAAMAGAVPSAAQAQTVAGELICKGKGTTGMILGSQESMKCTFAPAGGGKRQSYNASVSRVGLDVGVTQASTMVWTVLVTGSLPKNALAGSYGGASASGSVGIGGGVNVLVGGTNNSVSLQPLSFQGHTGFNVGVGVTELKLSRG